MNGAVMLKCLVLSDCAVPSPERPSVEGGGLRAWGLARGLHANAVGFQVSLAEPADGKERGSVRLQSGIEVSQWTFASLPELVRSVDAVIVSYCAHLLAPAVVAALGRAQQLILDCNVPIYVEVSARDSSSLDDEYGHFMANLPALTAALQRGDLFLCASDRQKLYYQGVLSAIGRLNPATYRSELLHLVPYGLDSDEPRARARPINALTGRPASVKLLWFGALYPWFDISSLLEAVALLNDRGLDVTLTIVGARNPKSTHPDFLAAFAAFEQLMATPRYRAHVFAHGWVDFKDRADWYLDADMGVMISRPGLENSLAWRTRLVDMVWGRLPMATNAGDPLSDLLVQRGAGAEIPATDVTEMADRLQTVIEAGTWSMRACLETVRAELGWQKVTEGVASHIQAQTRAPDLSPHFVDAAARVESALHHTDGDFLRKSKALIRHVRQHGVRQTGRDLQARWDRRWSARPG